MADIKKALVKLFGTEGGFQKDPNDVGNWTGGSCGVGELRGTKYGICAASYPLEDISNLTLDKASFYYNRDFWDPLKLSEVFNQTIAEEVLDTAVNCGVVTAARMLQQSVNLTNYPQDDVIVDGNVGSATINAVNNHPSPKTLYKALNGFQFVRYMEIVKGNPKQERFIRSWLSRVFESTI